MAAPHHEAAIALAELATRLGRLISTSLDELGDDRLSLRQYRLLERLETQPERPGRLASGSEVGQPTVSAALASLEARGLVERIPDPSDARASLCQLTHEGVEVLDQARARLQDVLTVVVRDLTDRQAADLVETAPALMRGVMRARERRRGRKHAP